MTNSLLIGNLSMCNEGKIFGISFGISFQGSVI